MRAVQCEDSRAWAAQWHCLGSREGCGTSTELLGAQCPQSPDRSVACPYPKACQDKSSVTTLVLRMHEGGFGQRMAEPQPHERHRNGRASTREKGRQGGC